MAPLVLRALIGIQALTDGDPRAVFVVNAHAQLLDRATELAQAGCHHLLNAPLAPQPVTEGARHAPGLVGERPLYTGAIRPGLEADASLESLVRAALNQPVL